MTASRPFQCAWLGLTPYRASLDLQEKLLELRIRDQIPDTLVLLEHPPTITLGAGAAEEDILVPPDTLARLGIEIVRIRRGGNATYHGPGQLVAYPIFKLPVPRILLWIRSLERVLIQTLRTFGLPAEPQPDSAGVRVNGEKIGFLGIKVSRSVSHHGMSLNIDTDLKPFSYIIPCSRPGDSITSMERLLGGAPAPDDVIAELVRQFSTHASEGQGRDVNWIPPAELWSQAFPEGLLEAAGVLPRRGRPNVAGPKPPWLKRPLPGGPVYAQIRHIMDTRKLHTVCESARCPNLGECWGRGTATFMILGDTCTRYCGFCAVPSGKPGSPDLFEPARVADAVRHMGLRHVVITSVNRDDLQDGGAAIWARTIHAVRRKNPETRIEVLIPDLMGNWNALQEIFDAQPDILNHNLETVPRLYPAVRPRARFGRSLELLGRAKAAGFRTKTGLMLGIGEHPFEIFRTLRDVASVSVNILTLGQYLRPAPKYLPVDRWVHPSEFEHWKRVGEKLGFEHVESGPLVRSSYHADAQSVVTSRPPADT